MPYTITLERVRNGFVSPASDADLTGYIMFADQADMCLTNSSVADEIGQMLKVLLVRHLATNSRDGGSVTSERAVSGASRSYGQYQAGDTGFLDTLKQLDRTGCVYQLATNSSPIQLRSIGRRPERRSTW